MPPVRPLGRATLTLLRAPLVTNPRTNAQTRDWTNAEEIIVEQCSVQPFRVAERLSMELNTSREFARSTYRVYAPAGTEIEPSDRAVYRGDTYELFGFGDEWQDLDEIPHHVAFVIRRMEG